MQDSIHKDDEKMEASTGSNSVEVFAKEGCELSLKTVLDTTAVDCAPSTSAGPTRAVLSDSTHVSTTTEEATARIAAPPVPTNPNTDKREGRQEGGNRSGYRQWYRQLPSK